MKQIAIIFALLCTPALPPAALADVVGPSGKVIDCFCTDTQGNRVELGQVICLFVNGRHFTARCEMSLNVPTWREQSEGCASSGLLGSGPINPAPLALFSRNISGLGRAVNSGSVFKRSEPLG